MRPAHHGVPVSNELSLSVHPRRNYRSREQGYLQTPGNPSAILSEYCNPHRGFGTATNPKLFVIEIILDCIQFKLFVMLLCHNEILLQYDISIVSCIVYLEFSHFDLHYLYHYLYTSTKTSKNKYCNLVLYSLVTVK